MGGSNNETEATGTQRQDGNQIRGPCKVKFATHMCHMPSDLSIREEVQMPLQEEDKDTKTRLHVWKDKACNP